MDDWRKSSYSNPNGECVEVRRLRCRPVQVRDTQDRPGPVLAFGPDTWTRFLGRVKRDELVTG